MVVDVCLFEIRGFQNFVDTREEKYLRVQLYILYLSWAQNLKYINFLLANAENKL